MRAKGQGIMRTKVVGVTHDNKDGTNRQEILYLMKEYDFYEKGDTLKLVHEKDNPADPNAVMVLNRKGQCIGYLNAKIAEPISQMLDDGYKVYAELLNITGGTDSRPTLGCNIDLPMIRWDPKGDSEDGKKYEVHRLPSSSGCCIPTVCFIVVAVAFIVWVF